MKDKKLLICILPVILGFSLSMRASLIAETQAFTGQLVEPGAGSAALVSVRVLQAAVSGGCEVEIAWPRSWRDEFGSPRGNHDGVWVFAKTQHADGLWRHQPVAEVRAGEGYAAERSSDGVGAFVFRAQPGQGSARTTLAFRWAKWPAGAKRIRLYGWPVVYVPRGEFFVGDGSASTPGRFHDGADSARPFRVQAGSIRLAPRAGDLWADGTRTPLPSGPLGPPPWDDAPGPLPRAFPTGFEAFWMQRFEVTQGQYADFLDTLTPEQAAARAPSAPDFAASGRPRPDNYRYTISRQDGAWRAIQPRWSMNWLTWEDGLALADWAGLRPMSELEYEKASRGPAAAVPGEYAWGTTKIVAIRNFDGEDGSGNERALPPEANTSWSPSPQDRPLLGPYAASALADRLTREGRGESFWGIADLSGNVVEMAVSAGLPVGRAFVANHGDGELSVDGSAGVSGWPRMGERRGGFGLFGYGYRGGDFYNPETDLRISSRNVANFGGTRRLFGLGFRAVRSAEANR
jgi:formylglycine-generating enzyme required for sulfatase activity